MYNCDPGRFLIPTLRSRCRRRLHRRGQTLVEYALILAVISIVAVGVMINLQQKITGVYSVVTSVVASAAASH